MPNYINHNLNAFTALNNMNRHAKRLSANLTKVTTGLKINGSKDDPAGYAQVNRMKAQVRSIDRANQNAQEGNALWKTADSALSNMVDILKTLKEKAIHAATDTCSASDRAAIQQEMDRLIDQLNSEAISTTYGGDGLLDGSHNAAATANKQVLYTQKLSVATTGDTLLTALQDRNDNGLGIQGSDKVIVSWVKDGASYSTEAAVTGTTTLTLASVIAKAGAFSTTFGTTADLGTDAYGDTVKTADGSVAFSITASTAGVAGQVSGFSIAITTADGVMREDINAKLNSFTEGVRAQDASNDNALTIHIGDRANQSLRLVVTDMRAKALGLEGTNGDKLSVTTQAKANVAISAIENALGKVIAQQNIIGAASSRLDYVEDYTSTLSENIAAAQAAIEEADIAKEMTEYTKNSILQQAAQAMLAQANSSAANVLGLLQ